MNLDLVALTTEIKLAPQKNYLRLGNLRLLAFAYTYTHHSCPPPLPPPNILRHLSPLLLTYYTQYQLPQLQSVGCL